MKCRSDAGFSLVEMLVAIVILGLIAVPVSSGLLTAVRINTKAEELMHAQLAVSSAVETLMATGIEGPINNEQDAKGVLINAVLDDSGLYYEVTASLNTVEVVTYIRGKGSSGDGGGTS